MKPPEKLSGGFSGDHRSPPHKGAVFCLEKDWGIVFFNFSKEVIVGCVPPAGDFLAPTRKSPKNRLKGEACSRTRGVPLKNPPSRIADSA